jgi:hypothetical protein
MVVWVWYGGVCVWCSVSFKASSVKMVVVVMVVTEMTE